MLLLYTFGGLHVEHDGERLQFPTRKAHDLLAYLITFRDRPHPRAALAAALWPDLPTPKARRRLSDALWRLRQVVGDHAAADDEHIWLNLNPQCWLDVAAFEQAASAFGSTSPSPAANLASIEAAIDLYQGTYLDGLVYDWVLLEQERLRGLYLETLSHLLEGYKQATDYIAALRVAQQIVATEPLHEAAHRELMRLYHLLNRDSEAIAQYQECRDVLEETLGVEPAPETQALFHTLGHRATAPIDPAVAHLPSPARHPAPNLDELPLVGRDDLRATLLGHLEAAAAGRGGIVLLEGEAGIGKSRLAAEIAAGARWREVETSLAQADEFTRPSYALLLSALSSALTPLRIRQLNRLVDTADLQAVLPLVPQVADALPDLTALPDLAPTQARDRLHQALVALILGLARIAPHLWILEDLHWADAETLAFLPLLQPHLSESRTLLLLTCRCAETRTHPQVWQTLQDLDRSSPFPRTRLARLSTGDVASLMAHVLEQEVPGLAKHVMEESQGIPLYVVEMLKTWRDEGHLLPTDRGAWRWHGDPAAISAAHVGPTIIDHRLSLLSPPTLDLLAMAAVIGAEVDFDLLAHVAIPPSSSPDPAAYDRLLHTTDELLRARFLVETETGYRFNHANVRQAVYDRLPPSRRQRLHRQVAYGLESLSPERYEALAHHFFAAGEREPATEYLHRAAQAARQVFAHRAALACYDQLVDLLTHPDDRPARYAVLSDRAEVLEWIGDRQAQGRDLEEMLHLAREMSDQARLAQALHRRSEWHRLQGQYRAAEENALAALELCRRIGDESAQAALLAQLGWSVIYTADHTRAAAYFEEALPIYESLNDLEGQINCLSGLTSSAELAGDYTGALAYLQRNRILADVTGDPRRIGRALHNLGVVSYDLGDLQAAENYLDQALSLKQSIGDRRSQAITHFYLGEVAAERDVLEEAQAHLEIALQTFIDVRDASWEGDARAALGRLALRRGDPSRAKDILAAAHRRRQELGEPTYAVVDRSYLALALLALDEEEAAWQHSHAALAELEAGLTGVEHPQRIPYNHFLVAQATRHWAAARAALEEAGRLVTQRAAAIVDPAQRETYQTGRRVNRAITTALADLPPGGCLQVRLAHVDAPAFRRPTPEETVSLTWTVDRGEADAVLARRQGPVVLRRQRVLRLVAEAQATDALPTVADLAGALQVSDRTIRADLAALREAGHTVPTHGQQPG